MLTGRSGYDIVVPTGSRIPPLIQAGALQKLDESNLKNLGNLDPKVMQLFASYDPNNEYALPYAVGTSGIGYNPKLVERVLGTRTIDSFSAVLDPAIASKLAKCGITMLDAPETMFSIAVGHTCGCAHPGNAHAYLDYVLEPAVIAEISNTIGQANGNAASLRFIDEELRNDPTIFPSQDVLRRLHLEKSWDHQTVREVTRGWTRIRTGQ